MSSADTQKYQNNVKSAVVVLFVCGIILLMLQLYYSNYSFFTAIHCTWDWLDSRFTNPSWQGLNNNVKIRTIALALFAPILLSQTTKAPDKNLGLMLLYLAVAIALLYLVPWLPYILPVYVGQALNIILTFASATVIIRSFYYFARYLNRVNESIDENARYSDGFQQMQELIQNPYSVNLQYQYREGFKIKNGYINVVNPFRATAVIGTPGSGKTYAILEEYMYQMIQKGFSAVIYDYKDPALSLLAYNYYRESIDNGRTNPDTEFVYISFKDLNKTNRCNPLKNIVSSAEALDFATVILTALNKKFEEKKGDFFVESAKNYTALSIYLLGLVHNGEYQSLPHLLSLIGRKSSTAFPVIRLIALFYPDMKTLFGPFEQAFENNALEQLSGQLASAQIGLGAIADKELAYVMTEDPEDFSVELHVNSIKTPQIVCIGNNPVKDTVYGLANSVYLSRLAKICNTKGTPCLFAVDELPTVFIKGLDNLIATGRSNKVATLLGYQDDAQLTRDYGSNFADAMIKTIGNSFSGAVLRETAKKLSDGFGEKKVKKVSKTVSQEGTVSTTINEAKEKKVPQEIIEELSQGSFVGRVCDEFDTPFPNKVFHGSIQVDKTHKATPHQIPELRHHTDAEFDAICRRNLIRIQTEISRLLLSIQEIATEYMKLREMSGEKGTIRIFIQDPDNPNTHEYLYIWLELAYSILDALDELDLKNDSLTFDEKFDLLLLDVYDGPIDHQDTIQQYRQELKVMNYYAVRKAIAAATEKQTNTIENQYNPF